MRVALFHGGNSAITGCCQLTLRSGLAISGSILQKGLMISKNLTERERRTGLECDASHRWVVGHGTDVANVSGRGAKLRFRGTRKQVFHGHCGGCGGVIWTLLDTLARGGVWLLTAHGCGSPGTRLRLSTGYYCPKGVATRGFHELRLAGIVIRAGVT